tara:strand:+ start:1765 stop:2133 length:369 start_codon:yes stop_codon:yes gene_type:complete
MVMNIGSLTGRGALDFLLQRVSALVIGLYAAYVMAFFVSNPDIDFVSLRSFFGTLGMKCFSGLAVLSIMIHGWIGIWVVTTDYIREHYFGDYANLTRLVVQVITILLVLLFGAWGFELIWNL